MHTQFCSHYRDYAVKNNATMHFGHKPGERMEVDWAGSTMAIQDNVTGEPITVYVFVAALPYSSYSYTEGYTYFPDIFQHARPRPAISYGGVFDIIRKKEGAIIILLKYSALPRLL
jgi:hypothetical protein